MDLHLSVGGAFLVLEQWRLEVVSVVCCLNPTLWGCLCVAVSMSQSDPPLIVTFLLFLFCLIMAFQGYTLIFFMLYISIETHMSCAVHSKRLLGTG